MKSSIAILVISTLAACGGGSKPSTTPSNAGSGSTGGATYGKPGPVLGTDGPGAPSQPDPCAAP